MQARALAAVGRKVQSLGLSVFVFTGYDIHELTDPEHGDLLAVTDVLVAGRYIEAERTLDLPWRGSANQRVYFLTNRYGPDSMENVVEVIVGSDGTVTITGFPAEYG